MYLPTNKPTNNLEINLLLLLIEGMKRLLRRNSSNFPSNLPVFFWPLRKVFLQLDLLLIEDTLLSYYYLKMTCYQGNMKMMVVFFVWCLIAGILLNVNCAPVDDYAVVIDAGSTGSRCFVFHVVIDHDDNREVTSASCGKVIPGLSSFVAYPNEASNYLAPLLHNAAQIIPSIHHISTSIFIKATAGMRLLSPDSQTKLWESVVRGINRRADIPFIISNKHIGTIDGHAEAYYAVLASNYVHGSIDGNLQ